MNDTNCANYILFDLINSIKAQQRLNSEYCKYSYYDEPANITTTPITQINETVHTRLPLSSVLGLVELASSAPPPLAFADSKRPFFIG